MGERKDTNGDRYVLNRWVSEISRRGVVELTASPKLRGLQKSTTLSTVHDYLFNEVLVAATIAAGEGVGVKVLEALIGGRSSPVTLLQRAPCKTRQSIERLQRYCNLLGYFSSLCALEIRFFGCPLMESQKPAPA